MVPFQTVGMDSISMPVMRQLFWGLFSLSTVRAYYIGEVYSGELPEIFNHGWKPDWRGKSYVNRCTPTQRNISGTVGHMQGIGIINGAPAPGGVPINPKYGPVESGHNALAMIFYKSADCDIDGTDQFIVLRFKQIAYNQSRNIALGHVPYRGVSSIDLNFLDGVNLAEYQSFQEVGEESDDWAWAAESGVPEAEGEAVVWQATQDGSSFEIASHLPMRVPTAATANSLGQSLEANNIEPAIGNLRVSLQSIAEMRYRKPETANSNTGGNLIRIPMSVLQNNPTAGNAGPNTNANSNVRAVQIPPGATFNIRTGPTPFRVPPTGSNPNVRNAGLLNAGGNRNQNQNPIPGTGGDPADTRLGHELLAQLFRQQWQQQQGNNPGQGQNDNSRVEIEEPLENQGNTNQRPNGPFTIERQQVPEGQQVRGPIPIKPRPGTGQIGDPVQGIQRPYYEMIQPINFGPRNQQGQQNTQRGMIPGQSQGTVNIAPAYLEQPISQPPQNRPEQSPGNTNSQNTGYHVPLAPGQALRLNDLVIVQAPRNPNPGNNQNPSSQTAPESSGAMIPETGQSLNLPQQSSQIIPELEMGQNPGPVDAQSLWQQIQAQPPTENQIQNTEPIQQEEEITAQPTTNSAEFEFTTFEIPERAEPGVFNTLYGDLPRKVELGARKPPRRVMTEGRIGDPTSPTLFDRNLDIDPSFALENHVELGRLDRGLSRRVGLQFPYPSTNIDPEEKYEAYVPPKRGDEKYKVKLAPGTANTYVPYEGWLNEGEMEERTHFPQLFENPKMELESDLTLQNLGENEEVPLPGDEEFPKERKAGQDLYDDWRRYGKPILGNLKTLPVTWSDPNWMAIKETYDSLLAGLENDWVDYYQERTDAMTEKHRTVQGNVQKAYTKAEQQRSQAIKEIGAVRAQSTRQGLSLDQQLKLIREAQRLQNVAEVLNRRLEALQNQWDENDYALRSWQRSYYRRLDDLVVRFKVWKLMAQQNIERNMIRLLHIEDDPEFGTFAGEVPRTQN
ncbi:hypothetical protein TWF718_000196 [Orbilia javanica]|uniref:Uncharacterized protein n=1 Tax=Orbilia javanica TaxID=47235 RepID=A0AAN8RG92_9PEZI